jgi:hypothetical protein
MEKFFQQVFDNDNTSPIFQDAYRREFLRVYYSDDMPVVRTLEDIVHKLPLVNINTLTCNASLKPRKFFLGCLDFITRRVGSSSAIIILVDVPSDIVVRLATLFPKNKYILCGKLNLNHTFVPANVKIAVVGPPAESSNDISNMIIQKIIDGDPMVWCINDDLNRTLNTIAIMIPTAYLISSNEVANTLSYINVMKNGSCKLPYTLMEFSVMNMANVPSGDIFLQTFGNSNMLWIHTTGDPTDRNNDTITEYATKLAYWNKIERWIGRHINSNTDQKMGVCCCGDCAIESDIWTKYREVTGDITPVITFVQQSISGSLFGGGHGFLFSKYKPDILVKLVKQYNQSPDDLQALHMILCRRLACDVCK